MVSIVVTIYNLEDCLDQCIESLVSQTYTNTEILLVDDGSTDKSAELCDKWAAADERISVIHKKNGGVCSARNEGIQNSRGEYIIFIDGDDCFINTHIETLQSMLKNNLVDLAIVGFRKIKRNKKIEETEGDVRLLEREETIAYILKPDGFAGVLWNKMFRMRIVRDNDLRFVEEVQNLEDMLFNVLYVMHIDGKSMYDPRPLCYYLLRYESASQKFNWKILTGSKAIKLMKKLLSEKPHLQFYLEINKIFLIAIFLRGLAVEGRFDKYYYACLTYVRSNLCNGLRSTMPFLEKSRFLLTALSPCFANSVNRLMIVLRYGWGYR